MKKRYINVRMPQVLYNETEEVAKHYGMLVREYIRMLLVIGIIQDTQIVRPYSPQENLDMAISIPITDTMRERIKASAGKHNLSVSDYVRSLVAQMNIELKKAL